VGDLGWAVEAEGKAYGADAAIDIELHVLKLVGALDVFLAHGWKDQWTDEGEADLASVGVAGEHGVDEREARMLDDVIGIVGLVAHEQDGGAGGGGDGEVEVWGTGTGVVCATEPEDVAAALDGVVAVDEHGGAVGGEGRDDVAGTDDGVVIAEDAEAGCVDLLEDFGAEAGGFVGDGELAGAAADEVAGDEDEVGIEGVDLADDALEEVGLGVLLEVDVRDLDDFVVLEGVGEVADGEIAVGDFKLVPGVGGGVGADTDGDGGGSAEESAACHGRLWVKDAAEAAGHRPF
jgi:hypothetical protein